jgi:hypothetical protein
MDHTHTHTGFRLEKEARLAFQQAPIEGRNVDTTMKISQTPDRPQKETEQSLDGTRDEYMRSIKVLEEVKVKPETTDVAKKYIDNQLPEIKKLVLEAGMAVGEYQQQLLKAEDLIQKCRDQLPNKGESYFGILASRRMRDVAQDGKLVSTSKWETGWVNRGGYMNYEKFASEVHLDVPAYAQLQEGQYTGWMRMNSGWNRYIINRPPQGMVPKVTLTYPDPADPTGKSMKTADLPGNFHMRPEGWQQQYEFYLPDAIKADWNKLAETKGKEEPPTPPVIKEAKPTPPPAEVKTKGPVETKKPAKEVVEEKQFGDDILRAITTAPDYNAMKKLVDLLNKSVENQLAKEESSKFRESKINTEFLPKMQELLGKLKNYEKRLPLQYTFSLDGHVLKIESTQPAPAAKKAPEKNESEQLQAEIRKALDSIATEVAKYAKDPTLRVYPDSLNANIAVFNTLLTEYAGKKAKGWNEVKPDVIGKFAAAQSETLKTRGYKLNADTVDGSLRLERSVTSASLEFLVKNKGGFEDVLQDVAVFNKAVEEYVKAGKGVPDNGVDRREDMNGKMGGLINKLNGASADRSYVFKGETDPATNLVKLVVEKKPEPVGKGVSKGKIETGPERLSDDAKKLQAAMEKLERALRTGLEEDDNYELGNLNKTFQELLPNNDEEIMVYVDAVLKDPNTRLADTKKYINFDRATRTFDIKDVPAPAPAAKSVPQAKPAESVDPAVECLAKIKVDIVELGNGIVRKDAQKTEQYLQKLNGENDANFGKDLEAFVQKINGMLRTSKDNPDQEITYQMEAGFGLKPIERPVPAAKAVETKAPSIADQIGSRDANARRQFEESQKGEQPAPAVPEKSQAEQKREYYDQKQREMEAQQAAEKPAAALPTEDPMKQRAEFGEYMRQQQAGAKPAEATPAPEKPAAQPKSLSANPQEGADREKARQDLQARVDELQQAVAGNADKAVTDDMIAKANGALAEYAKVETSAPMSGFEYTQAANERMPYAQNEITFDGATFNVQPKKVEVTPDAAARSAIKSVETSLAPEFLDTTVNKPATPEKKPAAPLTAEQKKQVMDQVVSVSTKAVEGVKAATAEVQKLDGWKKLTETMKSFVESFKKFIETSGIKDLINEIKKLFGKKVEAEKAQEVTFDQLPDKMPIGKGLKITGLADTLKVQDKTGPQPVDIAKDAAVKELSIGPDGYKMQRVGNDLLITPTKGNPTLEFKKDGGNLVITMVPTVPEKANAPAQAVNEDAKKKTAEQYANAERDVRGMLETGQDPKGAISLYNKAVGKYLEVDSSKTHDVIEATQKIATLFQGTVEANGPKLELRQTGIVASTRRFFFGA